MAPADYLAAGYYERWLWSTERRLLRRGTILEDDVDNWVARLLAGERAPRREDPEAARRVVDATREASPLRPADSARFPPNDRVRVRRMRPVGHTRCPRYVRGVTGTVDTLRGMDVLPDIGSDEGPDETVYAVAFDSDDVFGPSAEGTWTIVLDLFESYLEPA
jgi:nitrile hydratase